MPEIAIININKIRHLALARLKMQPTDNDFIKFHPGVQELNNRGRRIHHNEHALVFELGAFKQFNRLLYRTYRSIVIRGGVTVKLAFPIAAGNVIVAKYQAVRINDRTPAGHHLAMN